MTLPKFYVITEAHFGLHRHHVEREVLTVSNSHPSDGWLCLGIVSAQSPLGEGTYLGVKQQELREASTREVLAALLKNHPFGSCFRPALHIPNTPKEWRQPGYMDRWQERCDILRAQIVDTLTSEEHTNA